MDKIADQGFDPSSPLDTESRLQLIALTESMRRLALALLMAGLLVGVIALSTPAWSAGPSCSATANALKFACKAEVTDDYWVALANCLNVSDPWDQDDCQVEARQTRHEERGVCGEQYDARLALCGSLGEAVFEPDITPMMVGGQILPLFDPANFPDDPTQTMGSANPYFPLVPGLTWIYELREDAEVVERITLTVEHEIKNIGGVNCLTLRDVVREGDDEDAPIVEDTFDWYAQDLDGNVWYCGEISLNFEIFEEDPDPQVELTDVEGSWKGFRDQAKPGVIMLAEPKVGDVYRQEMALGDAEDAAEVISVSETENVPAVSCAGSCLLTKDFTPITPGEFEYKYYAPGVGTMLEIDPETGERLELVEFTLAP